VGDKARALELLGEFRKGLVKMYEGETQNMKRETRNDEAYRRDADATADLAGNGAGAGSAVFVALAETVRRHAVPMKPFDDLIRAFEQDQRVTRYETWEQVVDYCTRSADPVGRIVLYMCGYRDEERQRLSDQTCTALQLVNFWQDVRRDVLERDRIYVPGEAMRKFGVTEEQIREGRFDEKYREMMRELCGRTAGMFDVGEKLLPLLAKEYRKQIALFGKGGRAILAAVEGQGYDTLTKRPRLSKWAKAKLIGFTLLGRV
jgi:squalene synthase HpnC